MQKYTDVWERLADSNMRGKFSVFGLETLYLSGTSSFPMVGAATE